METSSTVFKPNQNGPTLIIPPRLEHFVKRFVHHYKASGNSPIMIYGPTGVGKSLFLKIFKILFQKQEATNQTSRPVVWANCAHFGGVNSDPNIARSELFGHVKGAHQNAQKDKIGLVHEAHGGALILEEIGELPLEVQAMLLTFIEDGVFRRVGSKQNESANVRIVGATNREEGLREDFKHRFFPFYISGLYSRRSDILYYMYAKYPEIVTSLTGCEVLTVLAYNWPGNCREIERVCRLITRNHLEWRELNRGGSESVNQAEHFFRMFLFDKKETMINLSRILEIYARIKKFGGDAEFLDRYLEEYGVRFSNNLTPVFSDLPTSQNEIAKFYQPVFGTEKSGSESIFKFLPIPQFERSAAGYNIFCAVFGKSSNLNANIIDELESNESKFSPNNAFFSQMSVDDLERFDSVAKALMMSIKSKNNGNGDGQEAAIGAGDSIDNIAVDGASTVNSIGDMTEKDLLKLYYEQLLKQSNGNIKMAAVTAGLNPSTFRSRLGKVGVSFKKNRRRQAESVN